MSRVLQGSVFVEPDLMTTGTPHVDFGLFQEPRIVDVWDVNLRAP